MGSTPILEKIGLAKVDPLIGVTIRSAIVKAGWSDRQWKVVSG